MKGIDVSHWQGDIDWDKVKTSDVEFAIIKAGGSDAGFYKDPKFERNYSEAKRVGIPIGSYYFVGSKCISYNDGMADAERFINFLNGKTFEYPVYIDLETTSIADKSGATEACIGFCETMEKSKYFSGIYASDLYGFQDRLEILKLKNIAKWVARYGSNPTYVTDYGMWQYSSTGVINGINGNVDTNECYVDYPSIIKEKGYNGFKNTSLSEKNENTDVTDWKTKCIELENKLRRILEIINE